MPVSIDDSLCDVNWDLCEYGQPATKLAAVVANAQRMAELEGEFGSFKKYLRSEGDFEATVKSLRKNFKFLGDFGSYYFLYVVGEQVPPHEEFQASRGK